MNALTVRVHNKNAAIGGNVGRRPLLRRLKAHRLASFVAQHDAKRARFADTPRAAIANNFFCLFDCLRFFFVQIIKKST